MPPTPRRHPGRQPTPAPHPAAADQPPAGSPDDQAADGDSPFAGLARDLAAHFLRGHLGVLQDVFRLSDEELEAVKQEVLGGK